jgi:hypothetical protein
MKIIDKHFFYKKIEKLNNKYWNKSKDVRWKYTEIVTNELKKINPITSIEMGTNKISLMDFSDTISLELDTVDPDNLKNKNYIFDARKVPWDIPTKKYDVFVALQVMEHLSPKQEDIFSEIKRISNYCILSLPYKWNCPEDKEHHMIDDEKILKWTLNHKPYYQNVITGRIVLCYNFNE